MKRGMQFASIIILATVIFSSCNIINQRRVKGDGNVVTKTYNLKDFSKIVLGSSMKVYISNSNAHSVSIEADENLFKYLDVRIHDGNTLEVESTHNTNLSPSGDIKVFIKAPSLDLVEISGAAQINTEGKFQQDKKIKFDVSGASSGDIMLRAPVVELESSGASTLTVGGECRDVKADASGAATINAFELKAENGDADASGASTIRMFSSVSLNATASGASGVKYKGNPQLKSKISGASSVTKAQ